MKILFLSHTAAGGVFSVGSHHLSEALANRGHVVFHIATPTTPLDRLRRRPAGNRATRSIVGGQSVSTAGVRHLIPRLALPAGAGPASVRSRISARLAEWITQETGVDAWDWILTDQPTLAEAGCLLRASGHFYRPTDIQTDRNPAGAELRLEPAHLNGVVATSEGVLCNLPPHLRSLPSLVLPNGVDYMRFASKRRPWVERRVAAVYVGALDVRFDWDMVRQLAQGEPELTVELWGPAPRRIPRRLPPNIRLCGAVEYSAVPDLLGAARVGLLPFVDSKGNRGRSPMKVYEYLAAGLYVLASGGFGLAHGEESGVFKWAATPAGSDAPPRAAQAVENAAGEVIASYQDWSLKAAELEAFLMGHSGYPVSLSH